MLTWVEVRKRAIFHNIREYRKRLHSGTLLMPVIKANAYGHGLKEIAGVCNSIKGVDRLCVVSLDEAAALIRQGIKKPIILLAIYDFDRRKIAAAIRARVAFPVYAVEQARKLNAIGEGIGRPVVVHVKVDCGASRTGILPKEAAAFVKKVRQFSRLEVEGIFSHFSSSEHNEKVTKKQFTIFSQTIQRLEKEGIHIPLRHMACSAAGILHPYAQSGGVRMGINLYGLYAADSARKRIRLEPALSWHTRILQVKEIPKGTAVSYGGTFVTKRSTRLAILPVGYFDGYDRRFSNKASVLIRGKRCPVRGRVCMNLTMVDVTGIRGVKVGDMATLIGRDGKEEASADELAKIADTINYEIVSRINPLIPRILK